MCASSLIKLITNLPEYFFKSIKLFHSTGNSKHFGICDFNGQFFHFTQPRELEKPVDVESRGLWNEEVNEQAKKEKEALMRLLLEQGTVGGGFGIGG